MTTLELEKISSEEKVEKIDNEALCYKLCANIFEGLLEGYNELKEKNPDKELEFQLKIEELKRQFRI